MEDWLDGAYDREITRLEFCRLRREDGHSLGLQTADAGQGVRHPPGLELRL